MGGVGCVSPSFGNVQISSTIEKIAAPYSPIRDFTSKLLKFKSLFCVHKLPNHAVKTRAAVKLQSVSK